jgi:hypothetical protein
MNKKYLVFLFLLTIGITLFTPCYNTTAEGGLFPPGWKDGINTDAEGTEQWVEGLPGNGMVKWIASGLIGAIAATLLLVTQTFMEFSQTLLGWITSEGFINVKFTSNSFVDIGWNMIRDLTNILIVLGLVVIALATILRITSYQMKKTLPLLLAVALLINFTPMLCGIVIDASNIIMNHFLKAGLYLTQSYGSALKSAGAELLDQIGSPSGMMATGLLLVGSSLFSGIIFLLYSALFLFRYVALWILVILSPLALFCYIFPGTKKIWNQWFSQFIQWCFIGIPAAFTIYLANEMTRLMLQGELLGEMSSMGKIMGYIVPVAFLAAGFFISLQTGAMGASAITSRAKKGVTAMGKATTGIVGGTAMAIPRGVAGEISKIKQAYRDGIDGGLKPGKAMKHTAKQVWKTKVANPVNRWKNNSLGTKLTGARNTVGNTLWSPFKGSLRAAWDVGKAGARATAGIVDKGKKICSNTNCGETIKKADTFCPYCGTRQ